MTCDFDRIDALAAGELPESERALVLEHMHTCPTCRAYYETISGLEGDEMPPEGFTSRVMDAVRATPQQKVRRRRPLWRGAAAAAACAVLVLGLASASGMLGLDNAAPESVNDSAPGLARDYDGDSSKMEQYATGDDGADQASDLPLTIHTVTDEALCTTIRARLADWGIPQLYPNGPREAYDLTADQVRTLNLAVPEAKLPEQMLQLELKCAE